MDILGSDPFHSIVTVGFKVRVDQSFAEEGNLTSEERICRVGLWREETCQAHHSEGR